MDAETLMEFCSSLPLAGHCFPFDEDTLVFKVCGKMFLYAGLVPFRWIGVKCDPDLAVELREKYPEVIPAYHSNKKHWNSIDMQGGLSDEQIKEWITHSFMMVVQGLPKRTLAEHPCLTEFLRTHSGGEK